MILTSCTRRPSLGQQGSNVNGERDYLHRCHFSQTRVSHPGSDHDHQITPEQICCTTIDADEEDASDHDVSRISRTDNYGAYANRTSQEQMRVLPKPTIDKKRKLRCSFINPRPGCDEFGDSECYLTRTT